MPKKPEKAKEKVISAGITAAKIPKNYKSTAEIKIPKDLEATPKRKKRVEKYKKIYKKLDKIFKKTKKPTIFLSHNVPYNTKIDKIVDKKNPRHGQHFGSMIARKIIEKYKPVICIGGHMHEHFDKVKIKKTVCINAGFGNKVNTFLEIKDGKIKQLKLLKKK